MRVGNFEISEGATVGVARGETANISTHEKQPTREPRQDCGHRAYLLNAIMRDTSSDVAGSSGARAGEARKVNWSAVVKSRSPAVKGSKLSWRLTANRRHRCTRQGCVGQGSLAEGAAYQNIQRIPLRASTAGGRLEADQGVFSK